MPPHQHGLGEALLPLFVGTPHLHLLGNALKDTSDSMPSLELVLDLHNKFLYFLKCHLLPHF